MKTSDLLSRLRDIAKCDDSCPDNGTQHLHLSELEALIEAEYQRGRADISRERAEKWDKQLADAVDAQIVDELEAIKPLLTEDVEAGDYYYGGTRSIDDIAKILDDRIALRRN